VTAINMPLMKEKRSEGMSLKAPRKAVGRVSITFPPDLYKILEEIAQQKKVSLAWVVRNASEKYLAAQKPMVRGK
jgi:metal-responsive CopG/Arc/MetJ family transcriptional regulator